MIESPVLQELKAEWTREGSIATARQDIVRVLTYTGQRYNFYDVIVMALDEKVLREQTERARKRIEHGPSISMQRRLNFEMSVKNLFQSLQDRERVPKIQGRVIPTRNPYG